MGDRLRQIANAAASAAISISRPNYFETNNSRGESYELKNDLNSEMPVVRKEAVKKVIANMTVGKDASGLFPDVVKCMQTDDLEMKKLVYLYLMNYAKSQPELVILAINTFCKDTEDSNPLIRALALRTMGCIRVDQILDYICEPLRKCLKDENPYVRKTAAICVAKVFDLAPELAEENGFLEMLQSMLTDSNPMVVSNVVAALTDIQDCFPHLKALCIDSRIAVKLLNALNECTEWGQVTILDVLVGYRPESIEEAEMAIEKILPRLSHVNPSVVLSSIKVLILFMDLLPLGHELRAQLTKKMAPPLVTLLSSAPEIQFVALRNINLILQKHHTILEHGVRVFFCKYNDPIYVKLEKLSIIELLVDDSNSEQVLAELAEYAREVDVEFVRRSISSIGQCALKVPGAVGRASNVLGELARSEIIYVLEEIAIVTQTLIRKYPDEFIDILPIICSKAEAFEDPDSRAAVIWILGQFGDLIPDSFSALSLFLSDLHLESSNVQSETLTACLRLYLRTPAEGKEILKSVIRKLMDGNENADLRDRAILVNRLLSADPAIIKSIVSPESIDDLLTVERIDKTTLNMLLANISTLASVFHRDPKHFAFTPGPPIDRPEPGTLLSSALKSTGPATVGDLLNLDFTVGSNGNTGNDSISSNPPTNLLDLLAD